ncbi:TPA: Rpn family recombination-promoting nuclease/putative transposase [Salmonella enterica]|uniref:Rpn family recombination-promoting nuclease/putative transposase n=1 Tax=Salmonella enterica TaxID=28901 RepID=A0A756LB01_SALER|nr:Rpn family recombination-promoting nuclease/putative transposase [Salmonella enterica]
MAAMQRHLDVHKTLPLVFPVLFLCRETKPLSVLHEPAGHV